MFLAIMKVKNERVAKFAEFEVQDDAEAHVEQFKRDFPGAFVFETSAYVGDLKVVDGTVTVDPPDNTPPTTRERIIARLKQDDAFRALVVAFRDDKGMTNKQVLDLLESKYAEAI